MTRQERQRQRVKTDYLSNAILGSQSGTCITYLSGLLRDFPLTESSCACKVNDFQIGTLLATNKSLVPTERRD